MDEEYLREIQYWLCDEPARTRRCWGRAGKSVRSQHPSR